MKRVALVMLVVALAATCTTLLAGARRVTVAAGAGGAAGFTPTYMTVPGYWMLAQEHVQQEIGLTDDQKEKLREISKKHYEQIRQGYQRQPATDWQKLSEDERKKKLEEMRAKATELQAQRQKLTDALKKQVEAVLTKEQLAAVKQIGFEQRAGQMLRNPRVLETLEVSKRQKARLDKNVEQTTAKMREIQKKSAENALKVLSEKQLEKLRGLHEEGYRSLWPQAKPQASGTTAPQVKSKDQQPKQGVDKKK